jgi:hypothetical protein
MDFGISYEASASLCGVNFRAPAKYQEYATKHPLHFVGYKKKENMPFQACWVKIQYLF